MAGLDDLPWDDLRLFLLAARAGTLAGAARAAGVQHTTIGRRLTGLERAVGAPLFIRGPDGLALTALGERLMPLVQEVERSVAGVREAASTQRDRVRLALPAGFLTLFADDFARFNLEHPELIVETVGGAQAADLRRAEADLALRVGPIDDEDLVARPLGELGWSLYASPRYFHRHPKPGRPEDLAGQRVIAYAGSLASTPAARWIEAHATGATIALRASEVVTMVDAAKSGAGIAMLPCMLADGDPALERLTTEVLVKRPLNLVYRREVRMSEGVRSVVRFLVDGLASKSARIAGVR